jgi:homoserine O-succinyltransferase/O-acetyltransferase
MPLIIEGGSVPPRWAEKTNWRASRLLGLSYGRAECIRIAFINNMPDAALEDTELQFFELLSSAAADTPVCIKLYSLPNVPRGERGERHLNDFYSPIGDLLADRFDGVIMTGTEPRQPELRDEPYWGPLTQVLDWAERNTISAVLSCLAAHAAVLHRDAIRRHPLPDKRFGVFGYDRVSDHPLTSGSADVLRFPHSRWNEVREQELSSCGYTIVTRSENAGVDLFVRQTKSLFVHFQGHPEYDTRTLLKEYRRDIRRFLRRERETYPTMPQGYFDSEASKLLDEFRENALARRHEEVLSVFPEAAVVERLHNSWQSSAFCIYRNWLGYIASKKAEAPAFAALARTGRAARPQIAAG